VIVNHPDVVRKLRNTYDDWWQSVLPHLENESVIGRKENPFKELYRKQYGEAAKSTNNASHSI